MIRRRAPWLGFSLIGSLILSTANAEELVRRPATVIRLETQTIDNVTYHWVYLRVEPKTRTRDAKPWETKLVATSAKITLVSPTGRRQNATRDALKPGARVLVSGWEGSFSSTPTATEIQVLEPKE
jgi:hypothetical protein